MWKLKLEIFKIKHRRKIYVDLLGKCFFVLTISMNHKNYKMDFPEVKNFQIKKKDFTLEKIMLREWKDKAQMGEYICKILIWQRTHV